MSPNCRFRRIRPVADVHEPQREVMSRRVMCDGVRPIIGPHLANSSGSCALIEAAAARLRSSVQIAVTSARIGKSVMSD